MILISVFLAIIGLIGGAVTWNKNRLLSGLLYLVFILATAYVLFGIHENVGGGPSPVR